MLLFQKTIATITARIIAGINNKLLVFAYSMTMSCVCSLIILKNIARGISIKKANTIALKIALSPIYISFFS